MGKYGSVNHNPAMKLSLNDIVACSAKLRQYIPGGGELEVNVLELEFQLEVRGGFVIQYHVRGIESLSEEVLMQVLEEPYELAIYPRFHGMDKDGISFVLV